MANSCTKMAPVVRTFLLWLALVALSSSLPASLFDPFATASTIDRAIQVLCLIGIVLFNLVAIISAGAVILSRSGACSDLTRLERLAACFPVGMFALSSGYLIVGLCGWISPIAVLTLLGLALASHVFVPTSFWLRSHPVAGEGREPHAFIVIVAAAPLLILYGLRAIVPTTDFDSLSYHWQLPQMMLRRGDVWSWEGMAPWNHPASATVLSLPYHLMGAYWATNLQGFMTLLVTFALLFFTARRLSNGWSGVMAGAMYASSLLVWEVAVSARIESYINLCAAAAAFFMVLISKRTCVWPATVGLWLTLGFGVGTKVLFAPIAVGFALWWFWERRRAPELHRGALVLVVVALLPASFWIGRNWVVFGSPLYPARALPSFIVDGVRVPVYPTADKKLADWSEKRRALSADSEEIYTEIMRGKLARKWSSSFLLDPMAVIDDPMLFSRDPRDKFNRILLLAPLLCLLPLGHYRIFALIAGLGLVVLVLTGATVWRYLLPCLPLGALAVAGLIDRAAPLRAEGDTLFRTAVFSIIGVLCFVANGVVFERRAVNLRMEYLRGTRTVADLFAIHGAGGRANYYLQLREHLKGGDSVGRALLISEMRSLYLTRDTVPDLETDTRVSQNWLRLLAECRDHKEIAAMLHHQGFTHLFFRYRGLRQAFGTRRNPDDRVEQIAVDLLYFLDTYGEKIFDEGDTALYRLAGLPTAGEPVSPQCGRFLAALALP